MCFLLLMAKQKIGNSLSNFCSLSKNYCKKNLVFRQHGFFSKCEKIRRKLWNSLTLSWRRFLYDNGLRHERVKGKLHFLCKWRGIDFCKFTKDWWSISMHWFLSIPTKHMKKPNKQQTFCRYRRDQWHKIC